MHCRRVFGNSVRVSSRCRNVDSADVIGRGVCTIGSSRIRSPLIFVDTCRSPLHVSVRCAGGSARSPSARFDGRTVFWFGRYGTTILVDEPPLPASCRSIDRNSLASTTSPTHSGRRSVRAGSLACLAPSVPGPATQHLVGRIMTEDVPQLMQYPEFFDRSTSARFPMHLPSRIN